MAESMNGGHKSTEKFGDGENALFNSLLKALQAEHVRQLQSLETMEDSRTPSKSHPDKSCNGNCSQEKERWDCNDEIWPPQANSPRKQIRPSSAPPLCDRANKEGKEHTPRSNGSGLHLEIPRTPRADLHTASTPSGVDALPQSPDLDSDIYPSQVKPSNGHYHIITSEAPHDSENGHAKDDKSEDMAQASTMRQASTGRRRQSITAGEMQDMMIDFEASQTRSTFRNSSLTLAGLIDGAWNIKSIVNSPYFEYTILVLILVNTATMAMQLQHEGMNNGHAYDLSGDSGDDVFPGAKVVFLVTEYFFTIVFTIELLMRLVMRGVPGAIEYCRAPSNWLDIFVVVTGVVGLFWEGGSSASTGVLRLFRLSRFARGFRLMKSKAVAASLQLLLKSLRASVSIMSWSLILLVIIQCIAAMFLGQLVQQYLENPDSTSHGRRDVYLHYGTFSRALLTMFEVTLGNWGPPCRILMDNIGEIYSIFFLFYRCFVGFAVLNTLTAVFVQQTTKIAQADEDVMIRARQTEKAAYMRKLTALFKQIDESGDGFVNWEEFSSMMDDPNMMTWLSTLDIDTHDLHTLFTLIDSGDGEISIDEFVHALPRLKGQARSIDMVTVLKHVRQLEETMSTIFGGRRQSTHQVKSEQMHHTSLR